MIMVALVARPAEAARPLATSAVVTGTVEVEPNDTAATANVLILNAGRAFATASIGVAGDVDYWRIDGIAAGSKIWVATDTGGPQNAGANSRDTVMDILAGDGTTVVENDDDDGTGNGGDGTIETGLASLMAGRTLTAGGTYYVRIRAFSATAIINPYKLLVVVTSATPTAETEPNNTAATAQNFLATGQVSNVFSGAIGAAGDADYYSVTAAAGDTIFFALDGDPERDGTGTDTVVEFRDAADTLLLSVDSSITGSAANPSAEGAAFNVLTAGAYYVKVRHFSATGTGTYNLMVANLTADTAMAVTPEVEPNNTVPTATLLTLNAGRAVGTASIGAAGDVDFWRIDSIAPGSRIWVATDTGGAQNAGATSRDTVMDVLAADGTTVIENDDDDGTGNGGDGTIETGLASLIGGRTLTAGGTYYIRIRAFSATAIVNPYRLFVAVTNVPGTAETEANNTAATAHPILLPGQTTNVYTGAIGAAGDVDYYSVPAVVGDTLYFVADGDPERDGTGTDLVVELRDPSDVLLLTVDSSITGSAANPAAEGAAFNVATAGTYFVRVRHFSATGTGTYHLMVANMTAGAAAVVPTVSVNSAAIAEGNAGTSALNFTVSLSAPSASTVTVTVDTADGTATAGSDYVAIVNQVVTFAPGETSKTVAVTINGDTTVEPNETFTVNLSSPVGATLGAAQGSGTITNDDATQVSINNVSLMEGNAGTSAMTFTVALSNPSSTAVMVTVDTADGTAAAGSDYVAIVGQVVTFAPGEVSKPVVVTINGDSTVEPNETFVVNLSNPVGATLGTAQGTGAILNDDSTQVSINNVSAVEGNAGTSAMTFTLSLSAASATAVTVTVNTANGTATAGSDYVAVVGQVVTFAPGETSKPLVVTINGDTAVEADETLLVNLTNATGATIATAQGTGTIVNDDALVTVSPSASLSFGSRFVGEPASAPQTVTFTASGAAATITSVALGGASPSDFVISAPTTCVVGLVLAAGQSCTVSIRFQPTLVGARSATLLVGTNSTSGTVTVALAGGGAPVNVPMMSASALGGMALALALIALAQRRRQRAG